MRQRPNFLWISFEDTNPVYGCYGDTVARTPNLDKLAAGTSVVRAKAIRIGYRESPETQVTFTVKDSP